jgi:hypothetical protein
VSADFTKFSKKQVLPRLGNKALKERVPQVKKQCYSYQCLFKFIFARNIFKNINSEGLALFIDQPKQY